MFKCKMCGTEFAGDSFSRGVRVRCPNCRAVCEEIASTASYVCMDCGLACDKGDETCPACGGAVVKDVAKDMAEIKMANVPDVRPTDSGKKKIAEILGGYTYVVLIGIWSCIIVPIALIVVEGFENCNHVVIYPMLAMSVCAAFMLSLYFTDNVRFLKWMFYYCILGAVFNIGCALYVVALCDGDAKPSGAAAVWVLLAFLFKRYKKL